MFTFLSIPFPSPIILVLRNLRIRWVRTILTALGIIAGVAAMVAVNATNASTLNSIDRFFDEAAGRSDLLVESAVAGEGFDEGLWSTVQRFPGVVTAAPSVLGITVPADEAEDWQQQFGAGGAILPGTNFWLMGRDPVVDIAVHDYKLVDGRLLQPGETAYNMLLVDEYADDKGAEVGEDFTIMTPGSGPVALRVVGLIAKEGIGVTNEGVIGIVPLNVAQALFDQAGQLSQIDLVVADAIAADDEALKALNEQIARRIGDDYAVKYPASRGEVVANTLQNYQLGLNFFSVVTLFVGSFLIYNAFAMTVVERTREIGMQRAIGMTRGQIILGVLLEAGILGAVGAFVGIWGGLLLARGLVVFMSSFTGQTIEQVSATPETMLRAFAVGVTVTIIAALAPAWQASRISPLQALRIQGSVDESHWLYTGLKFGPLTVVAALLVLYYVPFRQEIAFLVGSNSIFVLLLGATLCIPIFTGLIERLIRPFIISIFGNEGRLGSSNINRARGRTTLTVAALMVGISMVVGINGMTQSFEGDIQDWIDTALGGDLFVRSPLNIQPEIEARLLALPEITAVTKSRFAASQMLTPEGDDVFSLFVAIDPTTYLSVRGLRIQEGPGEAEAIRQLAAGDTILVSANVANRFNLNVNDIVLLDTKRGQRPFRIAAIVIDFGGGEQTAVTGSWQDLRRYFGINDISTIAVKLQPGTSLEAITDKIEDDVGASQNLAVESKAEFEQKIRDLSAQAFGLFDVLGLIGLVVAALGVINTMLMNVLERTRELGSLRSLGMTRPQVRRLILAEAAAIGFMGAIFGVAFGAVLSDVFIVGLRAIGGFVLNSQLPYGAMIYSFGLAFVVAIVAAFYPAYRASVINIITAIKHE
jgi:putative ABC transport system permease protein